MTYSEAIAYLSRDPKSVEAEAARAIKAEVERLHAHFETVTLFCSDIIEHHRVEAEKAAAKTKQDVIDFVRKCRLENP